MDWDGGQSRSTGIGVGSWLEEGGEGKEDRLLVGGIGEHKLLVGGGGEHLGGEGRGMEE